MSMPSGVIHGGPLVACLLLLLVPVEVSSMGILPLVTATISYPSQLDPGCTQPIALAAGGTVNMMGSPAVQDTLGTTLSLTQNGVTLNTGGQYTPGGPITFTVNGGVQSGTYTSAGSFTSGNLYCAGKLTSASSGTLVAPSATTGMTGTMTVVAMRANGQSTVTYEIVTLTEGPPAGGGVVINIPSPPPAPKAPPPNVAGPGQFEITSGDYTVRWEPKATTMGVTIIAKNNANWVGFALSANGAMLATGNNLALVGLATGGISSYIMTGQSLAAMVPVGGVNTLASCGVSTIDASVTKVGVELTMSFTLLYNTLPTVPQCTPSSGIGSINTLFLEQNTPAVGVIVSSGLTQTFQQHPAGAYLVATALSADGTGTGVIATGGLVLAHAFCMIIAWYFLAPFGIATSRYLRDTPPEGKQAEWFKKHRALMMGAALLTAIGFFIALAMKQSHFVSLHAKLGLVFCLVLIAQPLNGIYRPGKDHPNRKMWEMAHKIVLGLLLPSLALVLGLMGALLTEFAALFFTFLLLMVLLLVGLVARKEGWLDKLLGPSGGTEATKPIKATPVVPGGGAAKGGGGYDNGSVYGTPSLPNADLPPDWEAVVDASTGATYYHNRASRQTTWVKPASSAALVPPMPSSLSAQQSMYQSTASCAGHGGSVYQPAASGSVYAANYQGGGAGAAPPPSLAHAAQASVYQSAASNVGGYGGSVYQSTPSAVTGAWQTLADGNGTPYYYNPTTGETSWTNPERTEQI